MSVCSTDISSAAVTFEGLQPQWMKLSRLNQEVECARCNLQNSFVTVATRRRLFKTKGRLILHACSQNVLQHQPPHSSHKKLETPAFILVRLQYCIASLHPSVNHLLGWYDNDPFLSCLIWNLWSWFSHFLGYKCFFPSVSHANMCLPSHQ